MALTKSGLNNIYGKREWMNVGDNIMMRGNKRGGDAVIKIDCGYKSVLRLRKMMVF